MTMTAQRRHREMTRVKRGIAAVAAAALSCSVVSVGAVAHAADPGPPPVVGAQTTGDSIFPNVGNGGYDVQHYDLDISYDVGNTITASAKITAKADQPLSEFSLDFEGLDVDSVLVDGQAATSTRVSDVDSTKHKLIITPASPVAGVFTTVVAYSGTPTTHIDPDGTEEGWVETDDGASAVNEPVGAMTWYPSNNVPTDKATFDISVDIPSTLQGDPMAAASNGVLLSKELSPDETRTTWNWRQTQQMATYLSMVSIGKYDIYESDIVLSSGRSIHEWSFIDPEITPAQLATTQTNRALIPQILKWMESRYGPYPGVSAGVVVDVTDLGYALETQDRSYFENRVTRNTLIHEIAHQWFGNNVSPTDWRDIWLNEGPGDYMPRNFNFDTGASTLLPEATYFGFWNSIDADEPEWTVPMARYTDQADMFGFISYTRGGMTLATLRSNLGDDTFFTIMRTWNERYGGGDATTEQFAALAEEISGQDLSTFFTDWAYTPGKPAWPSKWTLGLQGGGAAANVVPGETLTYELTAKNTGRVPTAGALASVDVSDLVDDATLADLPAEISRSGNILTWAVPQTALAATARASFTAKVAADASDVSLAVSTSAASLGGFCGTTCSVTSSVSPQQVTPAPTPTIQGKAMVGSTLVAVSGAWAADVSLAYQWAMNGVDVAGATGATFTPGPSHVGQVVTVTVTGSRPHWLSVAVTSAATAKVVPAQLSPAPTPVINGTAKVGATLTVLPGTWGAGVTLAYTWAADGVPIAGATGKTLTLAPEQAGEAITVSVLGSESMWESVTVTSAATAPVAAAGLGKVPRPLIKGTPKLDRTLRAARGPWLPGMTLSYQWFRDGKAIRDATSAKYTVAKRDQGAKLVVKLTWAKVGYTSKVKTSKAVRVKPKKKLKK